MSKQTFEILEPAFPVALYEMEKMIAEGWEVSKEREPIFLGGLYSIEMSRAEDGKDSPVEAEINKPDVVQAAVAKKAGRPAKSA